MKNNVIDLGTIEFKSIIKKVKLAGRVFEVNAIVSVESSVSFLENISNGMSPRAAFCAFAFAMHSEAQKKKPNATARHIFSAMNDDEALDIMRVVISANTDAPDELWKPELKNIYERFEVYIREYAYLLTKEMIESKKKLVGTMTEQIAQSFLDIQRVSADLIESIADTIQSSFKELGEAVSEYLRSRAKQDPVMAEFGWGGLSVIPAEITQYVNKHKTDLSTKDVDEIISKYFNKNKYSELDILVNSWWSNPYFSCRKPVFIDAMSCYKYKLNIACMTLLTVHMEGIVKEFNYRTFNVDIRRNEKAIEKIKNLAFDQYDERMAYIHECYITALDEIEKRLTDDFDISDPAATSNLSRHKIAHGHMYEGVSAFDVLKTFLWVNELESLLSSILKRTETNKS